mgnify:CR=1 FL=1
MAELHPYRVMLILQDNAHLPAWLALAQALAGDDSELHLRGMVVLPAHVSLSEGVLQAQQWRDSLLKVAKESSAIHDAVRVYVEHDPTPRVLDDIQTLEIDLLLLQTSLANGASNDHTRLLQSAPCDIVLIDGAKPPTASDTGGVLLSLRGGPNMTLGLRVAKALAQSAPITLFHATDRNRFAPDLKFLTRSEPQIQRVVTAVGNIEQTLLGEVVGHKGLVMGATFYQLDAQHSGISQLTHTIRQHISQPIALVRAWHPEALEAHLPADYVPKEEPLSVRVDRWFAENTFDSSEFGDLHALLALKQKQGLSISVGLPALNEEATVGNVISVLKKALMDDVPLVDEFVLIDSNSTDNTVAIAESLGITVYKHPDILPEMGSYRGKGEALWKSLHVLKGDIIAWVDTDITNIHPRFIYGLLGPLLMYPRIRYVKGFYQRPIKVGNTMQAYGGGRVTELVARPWMNLFYPELSGLVQPLSGEYAGRRSALERVPFFSGYGVETGLLIDLLELYGLDSIAQTNLEVRVHHNQTLVGLSKMAFAILQVFIARLERRYETTLLDKANRTMKLILQEPDRFGLMIEEISDIERPPMQSVKK